MHTIALLAVLLQADSAEVILEGDKGKDNNPYIKDGKFHAYFKLTPKKGDKVDEETECFYIAQITGTVNGTALVDTSDPTDFKGVHEQALSSEFEVAKDAELKLKMKVNVYRKSDKKLIGSKERSIDVFKGPEEAPDFEDFEEPWER